MSPHDEYPIPQFHPVSTPSSTPPSSCSSRPRSFLGVAILPPSQQHPSADRYGRDPGVWIRSRALKVPLAGLDWTGLDLGTLILVLSLIWILGRVRRDGERDRERAREASFASVYLSSEGACGPVPGALLSSSPHAVRPFCVYHAIRSISVVLYSVMRLHPPRPFPIPFSSLPPFPIPLLLACAHKRPTHADAEGKSNNTRRPPG
jgi:hypothetical protein